MMKRTLWLAACLLAACGGEDEPEPSTDTSPDTTTDADVDTASEIGPDADVDVDPDAEEDGDVDSDAASGDTTAPRMRDLRAAVDGPVSTDVDLNGGDSLVHIPVESLATFTVFASDETSDAGALVVDFVDAEDTVVEPIETAFRNGLWTASVSLAPGVALRARVADEAGNIVVSDAALVAPSIEDSILGDWSTRFFGEAQVPTSVRYHRWELGSWSTEEGEFEAAGTWSFDGTHIVVVTEESTEGETPRRRAEVYVDEIYFAIAPLRLNSGGESGLDGVWTSSSWLGPEDAETTVDVALTLNDDGSFAIADGDSSSAGTWRTEVNEDYSEAFGNFLVLDTSVRDGGELAEIESEVVLYRRRGDSLLLSPQLRTGEE